MAYILAEVVIVLDEPGGAEHKLDLVGALAVQGLKASHKFALDAGSWEAAWLMTTLPDPYSPLLSEGPVRISTRWPALSRRAAN